VFDFRSFCDRCDGRHPASLHKSRKAAASALGRGFSVADAARVSHMPEATVRYWVTSDAEFQVQVLRAMRRAVKRVARHVREAVSPPRET
jgi:hypothetical protein